MAWRIDEQVIRGEIDNRTRGRVTGRIWLVGHDEPLELELKGNAWRDLAGRRLEFVNPRPAAGELSALTRAQSGVIGDCTASRKAKVPDVAQDELIRLIHAEQPFPWHWANCLYLEWFSATNGRVVVESAGFQLTVSGDATWHMSETEEEEQRRANAAALADFMRRLGRVAPPVEAEEQPPLDDPEWHSDRPLTEAEAETMHEEHEKLVDRINARLEREGPDADFERILQEEIDRLWRERGETPPTPADEEKRAAWIDDMNRAAEESLANPDEEDDDPSGKHPVAGQALELTGRVHRDARTRGWVPPGAMQEHPVVMLVMATSQAGAKFAGALNGRTWPPDVHFCASTIVRLKKARGYLEDALLAADACREQELVDAVWLRSVVAELHELSRACDQLIAELRARLEGGA